MVAIRSLGIDPERMKSLVMSVNDVMCTAVLYDEHDNPIVVDNELLTQQVLVLVVDPE